MKIFSWNKRGNISSSYLPGELAIVSNDGTFCYWNRKVLCSVNKGTIVMVLANDIILSTLDCVMVLCSGNSSIVEIASYNLKHI